MGLISGAWLGLKGERLSFGDLIMVNARDIWCLLSRLVLLTLLLGVISATVGILAVKVADAGQLAQSIYWRMQIFEPSNYQAIYLTITEINNLALALGRSPVALLVLLIGATLIVFIQVK